MIRHRSRLFSIPVTNLRVPLVHALLAALLTIVSTGLEPAAADQPDMPVMAAPGNPDVPVPLPVIADNPAVRQPGKRPYFANRHYQILARVKRGGVGLVFIGDSITQNYEKSILPNENFAPTWNKFYGDRNAVNMGFSGECTDGAIWGVENGELDGISPKVVVILIGSNNDLVMHCTAEQTAAGIGVLVDKVHGKVPGAKILLLGILPSHAIRWVGNAAQKSATDRAVNRMLAAAYRSHSFVTYLDIGRVFLNPDGTLNEDIFYDRQDDGNGSIHPNTRGQRLMAEAIEPTLSKLFGDRDKTKP